MTSLLTRCQPAEAFQYLDTTKPDQISYRHLFDLVRKEIPFTEVFMASTLLRGTLQIIQPQRLTETVVRLYARSGEATDQPSWTVIRTGEAATLAQGSAGTFGSAFMEPLGFVQGVILPVAGPLLAGYPGVLHFYRSTDEAFTEEEIESLGELARRLDELHRTVRAARVGEADKTAPTGLRIALFDANGVQVELSQPAIFDQETLHGMSAMALDRLKRADGDKSPDHEGDRVLVADADGDYLTYRAVTFNHYPALGAGRFVGFFAQPHPTELAALRANDVAADPELSRLMPALRFMQTEFRKNPTLVDTAKIVHLSPFHFHRRFSDLLGLTPKHFMLDCQIDEAKRELLAGTKDLATIAADDGFAHQSHFTSRFRQATGQTPTRWRRMARGRERDRSE
jgi:AraC-like DNA-binding protein